MSKRASWIECAVGTNFPFPLRLSPAAALLGDSPWVKFAAAQSNDGQNDEYHQRRDQEEKTQNNKRFKVEVHDQQSLEPTPNKPKHFKLQS